MRSPNSRPLYLALLLLLLSFSVVSVIKIDSIVDIQADIESMKGAQDTIVYDNIRMTRQHFVRRYVARDQLSPVDYWLFQYRTGVLLGIGYFIGGVLGGVAAGLLTLAQLSPGRQDNNPPLHTEQQISWTRVLANLISSGLAGLILYGLLHLPAGLLVGLLPKLEGVAGKSEYFASLGVLSVVVGLFAAVFYERLEIWVKQHLLTGGRT